MAKNQSMFTAKYAFCIIHGDNARDDHEDDDDGDDDVDHHDDDHHADDDQNGKHRRI